MENQRNNVKRLKVNVVEEIRRGLYLIEDESTAALFEAVEEHCQLIEVNKALNIVKPVLKSKNCIKLKSHLYAPQKSKKIEIEKDNKIIIEKLRNDVKKEGKGGIDSKRHEYKDNIMDYESSFKSPTWKKERGWADKIMLAVKRRHLKLKVDCLTRGAGNCFMISVLQQLRREDLYHKVQVDLQKIVNMMDHQAFRVMVKNFIEKSKTQEVKEFREIYNMAEDKTWRKYWQDMMTDGKWADGYFVRATALFLKMNINIVETSHQLRYDQPYHETLGGDLGTLWLGLVTGVHYQSLLPIEMKDMKMKQEAIKEHAYVRNDDLKRDWGLESKIANELQEIIDRNHHDLRVDQLTIGDGSCLMHGIQQQIQRPDVKCHMEEEVIIKARNQDTMWLRNKVSNFMLESDHPTVKEYKRRYDRGQKRLSNVSWAQLWGNGPKGMRNRSNFGDQNFLQGAAYCLQIDIKILDTRAENQFATYYANLENVCVPSSKIPPIYLGLKHPIHFQSLVPTRDHVFINSAPVASGTIVIHDDEDANSTHVEDKTDDKRIKQIKQEPVNETKGRSEDKKEKTNNVDEEKCPNCKKSFKKLLNHVKQHKICSKMISEETVNDMSKDAEERKKARIRESVASLRGVKRKINEAGFKEEERVRKEDWRKQQMEKDEAGFKEEERVRKEDWRKHQREKDEAKFKEGMRLEKENTRITDTPEKRLKAFREATMFGAIFICVSCQTKHFKSNVLLFDKAMKEKINEKFPIKDCIQANIDLKTNIYIVSEDKETCTKEYICQTCAKHLRRGKLPSMSAKNNLELHKTDEDLKDEGLSLTELENALIAKNIVFQKIFQLPKSRWSALKDKIINVPITDEAVNNVLQQLPRTPNEAGLIGLELKRRKGMKNSHKKQLINPSKIFKVLMKLKSSKNPYYQNIDSPDDFQKRCKETDNDGYKVIYSDDEDELMDTIKNWNENDDFIENSSEEDDQIDDEEEERLYKVKDPVKKFQFTYDQSLCMANKYPEVTVAPGEGQTPKGILSDPHWDVKAFPHLHNHDGSNGIDQERKVKLTDQKYFVHQVCNKETRFAESDEYLYCAVGYLEQKRIYGNISLVGRRGKAVNSDGKLSYELNDEYRVLENMPNTPKYWQVAKYEMLAKLDNFGPFQMFFTLSCADQRWSANFAEILMKRGYTVRCQKNLIDKDQEPIIEVKGADGAWKRWDKFIEKDLEESVQELIRGNVVAATRYYHHRLKSFISKIVMDKNNPLSVEYYSYRIEFQERGAAHAHGVLWCNMKKLENYQPNKNDVKSKTRYHKPFNNISKTFKKLRNTEKLEKEDLEVLVRFIDKFVTVSTLHSKVGEDVVKIVGKVNKHHHTKTCRKHGSICRFKFPRPPSPKTIIAVPVTETNKKVTQEECNEIIRKVLDVVDDTEEQIKRIFDMFGHCKTTESTEEHRENKEKRIRKVCKIADVDYEKYIDAISVSFQGYKVVLERDIDEIYVNNYNEEMIRAWNGNMDIQPVIQFFQIITYITDYITKQDTGIMEILKEVIKDSDTTTIKDKMKVVANCFLSHRQMGNAEATYKLIPELKLKMSNVTCKFVMTGPKEERSVRWCKASEDQMKTGIVAVKLDNHDGFWYQQSDLWSKYLRRPEEVRTICFAQFAKMYQGKAREEEDENDDEDVNVEKEVEKIIEENNPQDDESMKFHFIMTCENNGTAGTPLPKIIKLQNPQPGEASAMMKRTFPAALRFHKVNKDTRYKRYMLNEIMLYRPLTDEVTDDQIEDFYTEEFDGENKIRIVKNQVMEFLEGVQEARYHVEQMMKELDVDALEDAAAVKMDPAGHQDNEDCDEEAPEEHGDHLHCNPDNIDIQENDKCTSVLRSIELPSNDELKERTRKLDEYQKEVVNIAVKYAKDIVKGRKIHNPHPRGPFVMVSGGAGAGKSTVINVVAQWVQKIVQKEGDNPEQPCVVKTAFTGCAASNIEGYTLHGSFGFSFSNKHFALNDKSRDKKRNAMKNLVLVIVDEISMVNPDQLVMLDMRLQEIKEKIGIPFGGVGVMVFGDMMQLKPVQGRYICQEPVNPEYHTTHNLKPRWEMFQSIMLEKNHRQGKDKSYADMLNRIRIGAQTDEDMQQLARRVRKKGHRDLKRADIHIGCKRKDVAAKNQHYILKMKGKLLILRAKHHHDTMKKYKPQISQKDGNVGTTSFKNELILKIGAKVMLVHNIDVPDMLTNGTIGELQDVVRTTDGKDIDFLVIKVKDEKVGKNNRDSHQRLKSQYPDCIFIERIKLQYNINKKSGDVGSTATVIQFPVTLSYALTSHKVQGQTFAHPTRVALELSTVFQAAQAYVMLSRVQSIKQVFIVDKLEEDYIMVSNIAKEELKRLEDTSFNRNPTPWHKEGKDSIKIAALNCAGLVAHIEDIREDKKLLNGDVVHLLETSLPINENSDGIQIDGFTSSFRSFGRGKGIGTYCREMVEAEEVMEDTCENLQIVKFEVEDIESISIYRSSSMSLKDTSNALKKMININKPTLITGDMNTCFQQNRNNLITKTLEEVGFIQLVQDATHIEGGHIDHVYWLDRTGKWKTPDVERYSPYYSDHDALLVTLKET